MRMRVNSNNNQPIMAVRTSLAAYADLYPPALQILHMYY
jgi:hypothetical protein